jgi:hypothetical protein
MRIEGACQCGNVQYACDTEPVVVLVCHCKHCQRTSGGPYSVDIGVPREALKLTGTIATYHDMGDESRLPVLRQFCPQCGSPVVSDVAATPALLWLKAGTLHDGSWVKPQMNIWMESAQPWAPVDKSLPSFGRNPPVDG